jgi:CheY-like chemotaxis protein/HPt (histidine-containing phosphotransfer) domain-containing protein
MTVENAPPPPFPADRRGPGPGPLVLVADDTLDNQMIAVHMLERCGYRAAVAENGRIALEAMSERSYAAVLMDCHMPALDGYAATREVRRREHGGRRTPIIAMTANSIEDARERCLAAGMDDYLAKPLRSQGLEDVLLRWTTDPAPTAWAPLPAHDPGGLLDESVIAELESLDPGLLSSLLPPFFDEAADQLSALRRDVGHADAPAVAETAHKLKGSSASLGAARVSAIAAELETGAKRGELGDAGDLIDRLAAGLAGTREALGGAYTPTGSSLVSH